jgi:hypothetical protein
MDKPSATFIPSLNAENTTSSTAKNNPNSATALAKKALLDDDNDNDNDNDDHHSDHEPEPSADISSPTSRDEDFAPPGAFLSADRSFEESEEDDDEEEEEDEGLNDDDYIGDDGDEDEDDDDDDEQKHLRKVLGNISPDESDGEEEE